MRRPKTIKEIRKKVTFLLVINNPMIYKFLKDFTNQDRKLMEWQFLAVDLSPTFLSAGTINETRLLQTHIEEFS